MTTEQAETITITVQQQRFADWMADVLVYIVVLNLFVEYFDAIVIDSFAISILTAVLLKALLDALGGFEHRVAAYFRQREGRFSPALGILSVFGILFVGKFVILEVVNIVFGDHVELGHILDIVLLIIVMIATRLLVQYGYDRLGEPETATAAD